MRATFSRASHRHLRWLLVAVAVLLGALSAAEARPSAITKDDTFITAMTAGILNIEGGECFTDPGYSRAANDTIVLYLPCEEQADNQSYGFLHAPDGPWDRTALAEFAWSGCDRGFRHYWQSQADSGLDYYPVLPTRETWADGDRDIMCVVYNPTGKLNGSAVPLLR